MSFRIFTLRAAAAASMFLVASCGGGDSTNDANLIAFSDYESVIGWMPDPGTVTREQAHSGRYAAKVDGANEFGMGFGMPLGKAITRKPHVIRIAAWAFMTDDKSTARLGMQLFDPATSKEVFGDGINFNEQVKSPGKWVEIHKDIKLPENTTSTQDLRVFLWRGSATSPAYIDDLRITLVE